MDVWDGGHRPTAAERQTRAETSGPDKGDEAMSNVCVVVRAKDVSVTVTDLGNKPEPLDGAVMRYVVCDGGMRCFAYFVERDDAEEYAVSKADSLMLEQEG